MRKIRLIAHVSLDGVIQHENSEEFSYGNWTLPYRSPAGLEAVEEAQGNPFDLLLGRHTYDLWSAYWPQAGNTPIANGLNAATKYVVTHHTDGLEWGPVKNLGTDFIEGIRSLKLADGPDLVVWGSSTLTSVLLEQGLADEVILLVYPVFIGRGKHFFSPTAHPCELALLSTKTTPTGVLINTYRHVGALLP